MQRLLIFHPQQGLKESLEPGFRPRQGEEFVWLDLVRPSPEELDLLTELFHFHPLAVEDCRRPHYRPGIAQYDEYAFLTLRCVKHGKGSQTVALNVFLGPRFIVTVHQESLDFVDDLWQQYHRDAELFKKGVDFILYSLLEPLTATFFTFFDRTEDKLEHLEEAVFHRPSRQILNQVFTLRRQAIKLRKILGAQRDILNLLSHPEFKLIKQENRVFFLDIYNEMLRLIDQVETLHDLASSTLEIYLSLTSNRLNEIMKVLTVITTIMMPLSLIAGIYGMNFRYMPELEWRYGYFAVLGFMFFLAMVMLYFFRRKGWF
ncbi:magnesium/cobalt transporter CorA [Neomoorella humiferrea]|uniref:Magnesium transport protein CorA n=1 Tax=Neomoorella humiferrea TaxID=676965 RepID=A0A2T0AZ05_9FIRM|nr:magnesium/cobalt transporter CorA [Moorella humiferrea]PRR76220.1 Magnesium transport protein CorA [Moorella humiferrea]